MQKRIISLIILMVLLLSACSSQGTTPANETEANNPLTTSDSAAAESVTGEVAATPIVASGPAECRLSTLKDDFIRSYSEIPPVTDEDWTLGNADAPVSILVYSDIQCPYCSLMDPILVRYVTDHPDKAKLVFRHFPFHQNSANAAIMTEAAGLQGADKFEAIKEELFATVSEWGSLDEEAFIQYGYDLAKKLGMDDVQFSIDMASEEVQNAVSDDYQAGVLAGVAYTPYVTMNGQIYSANPTTLTQEELDAIIDGITEMSAGAEAEALASLPRMTFTDMASLQANIDMYKSLVDEYGQEYIDSLPSGIYDTADTTPAYVKIYKRVTETIFNRQFDACPPQVIDPEKTYKAIIKTDVGDITISLNPEAAPVAVNSFVFLAENGWYDNITFHRVIPDFVVQSGDPSGYGLGNPGYLYDVEIDPNYLFDQAGRVGVANSGANASGSQFFITFGPQPDLNGSYTVFGQVVDGLDVLNKMQVQSPSYESDPSAGTKLLTVEIIEE
jgi:cyclophilin family peptidyl-prolyl cis-trans isomerase/protein-disulfide isomerase